MIVAKLPAKICQFFHNLPCSVPILSQFQGLNLKKHELQYKNCFNKKKIFFVK